MARHADAILTGKGMARDRLTPMANTILSGQNGHAPDLRHYHGNADYIRRQTIARMFDYPRGFDLYGSDRQIYIDTLKALVELHAQSWEGLNKTLSVSSQSSPIGGSGEQQDTPSNVTRARSEPVLSVPDKYGLPFQSLFTDWIQDLIQDPDTGVPNIITRSGANVGSILPDFYTMTVLFFEPDPTFSKVQRAWLVTNMYPTTAGDDTGRRDKSADGEQLNLSIQFTGVQQVGRGVNALAQAELNKMRLAYTDPNNAPAFVDRIDESLLRSQFDYVGKVNEANARNLRPTSG